MKNKSQIIVPHKTMKNKGKIMGLLSLLFLLFSILYLVSIIFFILYNSIVEEEGREEKRKEWGKGKEKISHVCMDIEEKRKKRRNFKNNNYNNTQNKLFYYILSI